MATKTLLPSSSLITDRYCFRSHSNENRDRSKMHWNPSPHTPKKRYQFSSKNTDLYPNIYKFPVDSSDKRSHSSDSNRYYFSLEYPSRTHPPTATFIEDPSMNLTDRPYLFSPTSIQVYRRVKPMRMVDRDAGDTSLHTRSISPAYPRSTRMDTVTSTNGLLSLIKRLPTDKPPTVHFEPSVISSSTRSYLKEIRDRLSAGGIGTSSESFERSVDRLISSVNQNYGQPSSKSSSSSSSSSNYVCQYYAREDHGRSFDSDDEYGKFSYRLNINRTHTQIMKTVNRSLIDRSYQSEGNRRKYFEQNVHRYLRFLESQSLQRELNYDLIRCFSSSYLNDLRQDDRRRQYIRSQRRAYTYEDIQDIHNPSILEAYQMRTTIDRERQQRTHSSLSTAHYSPSSSSEYSPVRTISSSDRVITDQRSTTVHSSPSHRHRVDVFYEIIQESFRGVDASIAGHISKASQLLASRRTTADPRPLWSDDDLTDTSSNRIRSRRSIPQQRKLSRYLSAVNRSLLDHPGDLVTDFYLSKLNRSMQESVRQIETIARDKANEQEFRRYRPSQLGRSLSADHLYQVRKEHLRYKHHSNTPTSFTTEDVADIYQRFALENYKRKIAIELERRRRARENRLDIDVTHRRILPIPPSTRRQRDFPTVSPPVIVQTKEVIMGRARRTLTQDGTSDIVHHITGVSPPPIYSVDHQPASQIDLRSITKSPSPRTNFYTNIPQVKTIHVHHANRIASDSESLSMVNIEPNQPFNQYDIYPPSEQTGPYIQQRPSAQQTTLVISIDEHIPIVHERIPITEILPLAKQPRSHSSHTALEISADSGISLNVSQPQEPPTIYHSSHVRHIEPLPELEGTIVINEIPLASLFEEIRSAKQIIDQSDYWKTGEKFEENLRIATVDYNIEWIDEKLEEFSLNIQHAHYRYPEPPAREYIRINRTFSFALQPIIEDQEEIISLPADDLHLTQQLQLDHLPNLENPIHSTNLLTLNYPDHHSTIRTLSQTSSYLEMETFLNNFEESIDHEQHLPFINQISLSYATSINEQNPSNYRRALPLEWYQPTIRLPDEQLVEQWTVENHLATIQHEGTLHRHQVDFLTSTDCENAAFLASNTDAFCINERFEDEPLIVEQSNVELISHCSPTSDYETDSVEKDNETLIIPLTILPSSSITNPTLLSQSSPLLTSHTAPIAPIVYFLDVLALEQKEINTSTKDFLLTIGFGQNLSMNELHNTVASTDQARRPIWINRSLSDNIESLPSSIHQEYLPPIERPLNFATEHVLEDEDFALLIHPHRFQFGYDLEENIQPPLNSFIVSSHLHLPMTNEIIKYHCNTTVSELLPQALLWKTQTDEILSPDVCQLHEPEIFAYAQTDYILDHPEQTNPISLKFDPPSYIDHYHIQSLYPFPDIAYADCDEREILLDHSNFILLTATNQNNEKNDVLSRFVQKPSDEKPYLPQQSDPSIIKSTSSVGVRPPVSPESGPIYEGVKIHQHVDADMGSRGRYEQRANYIYENEDDRSPQQPPPPKYIPFNRSISPQQPDLNMTDRIVEHVSEDEKSTSSEEVVFEEWTEEVRCIRTDEVDRRTNEILRSTINPTGERIKGDVIKEHYKEKNTRIKGRKSYDVIREIPRRTQQRIEEEFAPPASSIVPRSSSTNRQWTSEDIYTTEIVQDPHLARELESTAKNYDRVRPSEPSPPPPTTRYDRISTVVTPSTQYTDARKQQPEDEVVSEEYHVEVESTRKQSPTSDWRNKLKEIYTPTSDDDQYRSTSNGNYLAQRVSVIPSNTTQPRFKEVQIRLPGHDKTPPERRRFDPSPPSRHTMKEVLVCVPRGASTKENDQERKRTGFTDIESPRKGDQDRSTYSRVGQLRSTFESSATTTGSMHDEYKTPPTRPANERRMSETHTAPSLVSDRISRFENLQSTDHYDRKDFEKTWTSKQVISSVDSDMSTPAPPIYQSTPKSFQQQQQDVDAGHESEDELSDPKQYFESRRRTSKTRLRDFSQSTSSPIDTTPTTHRATSHFDETNMENVLSHVPTSKGKGMLIELSPPSASKSHLTSDSGVFDYSTTPATYRQTPEGNQTSPVYVDDSLSRSTYRHDREFFSSQTQPQQQQQRTVRRQLTSSPPTQYENLSNYQSRIDTQGKIPITTESRSIKPLVVDAYETFETETQVECEVQRTNEMKESTTTERMTSPISPSKRILTTTTHSSIDTTPARRVLLNDRPQYYESPKDQQRFQPIQRDHSPDELPYQPSSTSHSHTMEVTTLSPKTQITFEKSTPTQIVAVVRVPELSTPASRSGTTDRLHYQRVHAGSYRPPPVLPSSTYQQRSSRSAYGPSENTSHYSSPINIPIRSASSHSNLHEQNQQRQQQQHQYPISSRTPTRFHSGSLGNLYGSNLEFEIEIEKRPPHKPEQPTSVSLDQPSRAVVTTSKDGRVSVQNIAAFPGNTVVINSDFHSSDRSLNRSSGYFSSDEPRSQGHATNYSSDEQSSSSRRYHFNPSNEKTPTRFNETINQIDALYSNLEVQNNAQRPYDFSRLNRRRQMTPNATDYSNRYTSTGFEQTSSDPQMTGDQNATTTPTRPSVSLSSSGILADYGSPNSTYGSNSNPIVQQNRWNAQSQIVQRNRTSVRQMKQKNAAKRRNGHTHGQYSDEDEENDSPLSDGGRAQASPRYYYSSNHHYQ